MSRHSLLKDSDEPQAVAAVKLALDRRMDVNAPNETGETALHAAARMNYPKVAALLLESGARPDTKNKKGESPLDVAGSDTVKQVLLKRN